MTRRRAGFTLLEMIVALIVTGLVALASYAALDAGLATRDRIGGALRERESTRLARTMLEDALRHAVERGDAGIPFAADDGAGGDVLAFDTRGVTSPLGASALSHVELRGATLSVTPLEERGAALRSPLAGVRGIRISTLGPDGWGSPDVADHLPDAVRVEFVPLPGGTPLAPLVVKLHGGVTR